MIDKETIDRILDATQIVDVISDFVSLRRRGGNYIACCPFHNEKTPSFSVSPSKGIFKCFGCGKAGSAVSFLMEHEQMSYVEAIKYLGRKYGIEVNEKEEDPDAAAQRHRSESLIAVSEFAASFFTENLFTTSLGRAVGLSYFRQQRGFSEETIRKFCLGFSPAPGSPTLYDTAVKKGYKKEFLIGAGLCYEQNSSGRVVDKFIERVMFPIHSISGRVIAFGGRTLRTDKSVAKYMNSPETEIYHKSRSLYGIFQAKSAIVKASKCYLVEGYTDVISMHQAGIENVVASSGTSLTTDQIRLIRRFTENVTVLYDGDSAGIKASLRGINMLLEEGLTVKVVLLPDGEDPDSFARSRQADELLEFLNENETDFIEFKYSLLADDIGRDPLRKAELIREIVNTIAIIPDRITRTVYIEKCAARLDVPGEVMFSEVAKARNSKTLAVAAAPVPVPVVKRPKEKTTILDPCEREILFYLLKFGEHILHEVNQRVSDFISSQLSEDDLVILNPVYNNIYNCYFAIRSELGSQTTSDEICRRLVNSGDGEMADAVLKITVDDYNLNVKEFRMAVIPHEKRLEKLVPESVMVYKLKCVEYRCMLISQELKEIGNTENSQRTQELLAELKINLQIKNAIAKELKRV